MAADLHVAKIFSPILRAVDAFLGAPQCSSVQQGWSTHITQSTNTSQNEDSPRHGAHGPA